jgi:hypothetical protein
MANLYRILAGLCVIASITMYQIGSTSTHLSELKDFYLVPLPLGVLLFFLSTRTSSTKKPS